MNGRQSMSRTMLFDESQERQNRCKARQSERKIKSKENYPS